MSEARLVQDGPLSGSRNMALDQTLLEQVGRSQQPALRFYRWREPTLSLGYFQHLSERSTHRPSQSCPLVRRSTGGGAILHDREVTYSVCVPIRDRISQQAAGLYRSIHDAIRRALATFTVVADRFAETPQAHRPATDPPPFLCFQRRTAEDLIVAGYKVVGSAQRRAAGAVLQHGSILLAASPAAPELPGIRELTGREIPADSLAERLAEIIAQQWELAWADDCWTAAERRRGEEIAKERFAAPGWTTRRP